MHYSEKNSPVIYLDNAGQGVGENNGQTAGVGGASWGWRGRGFMPTVMTVWFTMPLGQFTLEMHWHFQAAKLILSLLLASGAKKTGIVVEDLLCVGLDG